jgi:glycosyltransferase involved in cell wall biosynthesis
MPRSQKAFRRLLDWPEAAVNGYVYGMVAANKGYPPRKAFPEVFEAFGRVRQQHDDVWLYLHTLMSAEHGGLNLVDMAKSFGIADRVLAPNQHLYLTGAYDEQDMARVYNSFDVLAASSYSEGFGIPLIEAQANGVPVITTDAFAMTELCGAGWKIPWDHRLYMPIGGCYVMPSVDALTRAMLQAHEAGRAPFVQPARTFALDYDWGKIIADYWRPLIQRLHRELTPRVYQPAARPALVEV